MNDSLFWDTHTAILENIRLQYFAWDQTDGMACGFQYINKTSKMPPSFSLETKFAIQLRYGCDRMISRIISRAVQDCSLST